MDADNDQFIEKLLTEQSQLRLIVEAIDSAECPEFQHHNFTAQLSQAERLRRVEPFQIRRKFGRVYRGLCK